MSFLYNLLILKVSLLLRIVALFNNKIKLFIKGRDATWEVLSAINKESKYVWFHAASLGEYEQGVPVMKSFKEKYPAYKIVLTFFSPSGYEVRKNTSLADVVCYLPMDSRRNVARFLKIVQPQKAFFIKYEYWPNYLKALEERKVPVYLISGIFSDKQLFFKWYGGFYRDCLSAFTHFFVQDQNSKYLLERIEKFNVSVSGDTRFDRVLEILDGDNSLDYIEQFVDGQLTVVVGSSWPKDETYLMSYINSCQKRIKWIIAPHNIKSEQIKSLQENSQKKTLLFSEKKGKNMSDYSVFIVDTIGVLTKIYSYGNIAYVGGGFENGIHNILEPATFGMPVVIGPKFQKFKEAVDMVDQGGCVSVSDENELHQVLDQLISDEEIRGNKSKLAHDFVQNHAGATSLILDNLV